jgi:hypothetical protein
VDLQRRLAASPFPTDAGAASAETRRLIAAAATEATPAAYLRAVAALCGDRLLVPVVATTTRLGETVSRPPLGQRGGDVAGDTPSAGRAARAAWPLQVLMHCRAGSRMLARYRSRIDSRRAGREERGLTVVLIDVAGPQPFVLDARCWQNWQPATALLSWLTTSSAGCCQPTTDLGCGRFSAQSHKRRLNR